MAIDAPRAQLIHIETDRRLGHEWDEWDGGPLPNRGDFSAPPGLFFRFAALTLVVLCGAAAGVLFLLSPRLAALAPALPRAGWWGGAIGWSTRRSTCTTGWRSTAGGRWGRGSCWCSSRGASRSRRWTACSRSRDATRCRCSSRRAASWHAG